MQWPLESSERAQDLLDCTHPVLADSVCQGMGDVEGDGDDAAAQGELWICRPNVGQRLATGHRAVRREERGCEPGLSVSSLGLVRGRGFGGVGGYRDEVSSRMKVAGAQRRCRH